VDLKSRRLLLIFLIAAALLSACAPKAPKKQEDVQKFLMNLRSYKCDVVLAVTNNRSTNVYKQTHLYKYPDKYRIEIIEPNGLKGQTTIYNGEKAYIFHPQINTYLETQNFKSTTAYSSFVGSFVEQFKNNGGARFNMEDFRGRPCFVLELPMEGKNPYRAVEKIWIDAEHILPVKAEILDKNKTVNVQVLYEKFEANPKLEETVFNTEKK
jgi:outer membrane lipoprotein-sorting protein